MNERTAVADAASSTKTSDTARALNSYICTDFIFVSLTLDSLSNGGLHIMYNLT